MKNRHFYPTLTATCFAIGASLMAPVPVRAQSASDTHQVYISWPDLSVEPLEEGAKYEVLTLVDSRSEFAAVFYVIVYIDKERTALLGTFNCNHTFQVMQTSTNGLYDIICAQENQPDEMTVYYLTGEPSGNYSINLGK